MAGRCHTSKGILPCRLCGDEKGLLANDCFLTFACSPIESDPLPLCQGGLIPLLSTLPMGL